MADAFDVIVIGMGPGGEEIAGRTAEAGLRTLGIEKKLVGGECPYWGCIPSKAMVRAGDALAEARRIPLLAGRATVEPDWGPVARRVGEVTADWDDTIAVERFQKKGGTLVRGPGRIVEPGTVEVDGARYTAARAIVVATGTQPAIPPLEGLSDVEFWTNREAIEAKELPRSLVILGGGPIGLELAQTFRRFGTEITIVETSALPLPMEEPENSEALAKVLTEEGIVLRTEVRAQSVRRGTDGIEVTLSDGDVAGGERLLVATGRRANLQGLGLENVGVDPSGRFVEVDEHLRAADGVWAIGDITGKGAFTHMAVYQARVAAADVLGEPNEPADYTAVPRVTFTDPEIGSVGMGERQAREAGIDVRVGLSQNAHSTRGYIHGPGAEHGVIKLIADSARGVLIGASVMGPAAGEIVGYLTLAIKEKVPVARLREMIFPYPTFVRGIESSLRALGD